jgi:hypothetical protein
MMVSTSGRWSSIALFQVERNKDFVALLKRFPEAGRQSSSVRLEGNDRQASSAST